MAHSPLNFERAQYGGEPIPLNHCAGCSRWIEDEFYRANGDMICPACAVRIRGYLPSDTREAFLRSVGAGVLAAVATSLGYLLLFRLVGARGMGFGVAIGAIGVGYAVGKAMRSAARGAGGRRYQWAAALLTYAAISIPLTAWMMQTRDLSWWAYPFLMLAPVFQLIQREYKLLGIEVLFVSIGVRWAWGLLRPHPLKITGPERLSSARQADA